MSDEQQTAADNATEAAIEAHLTRSSEAAVPAFNHAAVAHRRAAAAAETGTDPGRRDGNDAQPLSPMPDAPMVPAGEVDSAIAKLNEYGDEHADLVTRWGNDFGANLSYAKEAFWEISTSRPDLIAKFEASGLGDDPAVLEHLASCGRSMPVVWEISQSQEHALIVIDTVNKSGGDVTALPPCRLSTRCKRPADMAQHRRQRAPVVTAIKFVID